MSPGGVEGQLRRGAFVQPVAAVGPGDLLLGFGVGVRTDVMLPLSGLSGNLTSLADLHFALGIGSRAVFEIDGAAVEVLAVDGMGESAVPLDPGVADGRTSDAGDFRLSVSFLPIGDERGFSAGGHVGVKLPNSNETRGIGPNTTDVTIAALFSWGADRWRASGWAGVGILEAPLESFEQNDVFTYAFEWLWRTTDDLRFVVGARGRASTRGRVPIGTEDLGEVRVGAEWALGAVRLDVGVGRGITDMSGAWTLEAGAAWALAR